MLTTINPGDWTGTLNGVAFGVGTSLQLAGLTGWFDAQSLPLGGSSQGGTSWPDPKAYANGSWIPSYWMPSRTVTLQLSIMGDDFAGTVSALRKATIPSGPMLVALSLQVDAVTTTVYGHVTARTIPTAFEYQFGLSDATVTFECPDPRRFGVAASASTGLPSSTGGLAFPATWPAVWAATQQTGLVDLTSPGDTTGPVKLRINGPCVGPRVTHGGSGSLLAFASTFTINAGDWVDVDMEAQTVLYNAQASRNGSLVSRGWFGFDPGDNTVVFNAASYNTSASMVVTATPAWI